MKKYKIIVGGQILLMTKKEIENLDTKEMTSMDEMFSLSTDFDGDLSKWNLSAITTPSGMFKNCTFFNQDISGWNENGKNKKL